MPNLCKLICKGKHHHIVVAGIISQIALGLVLLSFVLSSWLHSIRLTYKALGLVEFFFFPFIPPAARPTRPPGPALALCRARANETRSLFRRSLRQHRTITAHGPKAVIRRGSDAGVCAVLVGGSTVGSNRLPVGCHGQMRSNRIVVSVLVASQ